jgi:hypothetical protein
MAPSCASTARVCAVSNSPSTRSRWSHSSDTTPCSSVFSLAAASAWKGYV